MEGTTENSALQIFSFQGKQVRVVVTDDAPEWVLKDVCDILEYHDANSAARLLDDDEKGTQKVRTPGGMQDMITVNEPGLFKLILRSNKPEAKEFQRLVTHEILPAIRKTGEYRAPAKTSQNDAALMRAESMLNNSRVRVIKCLRETISDFADSLSPQSRQALAAYISDTITGQPGLIPLPVVEKTYSASDLGAEMGVSAHRVGLVANRHGLKTPENGIFVLDKARGHDKQVTTFRYNEKGRATLVNFILGGGKEGLYETADAERGATN
jgi:prophage antirepressor-like protein